MRKINQAIQGPPAEMQTVLHMYNGLTEGEGRGPDLSSFDKLCFDWKLRLNTKGTVHKHHILVAKKYSSQVSILIILKLLHTYNGTEQISKRIMMVTAEFCTVGVRISKE